VDSKFTAEQTVGRRPASLMIDGWIAAWSRFHLLTLSLLLSSVLNGDR